MNEKIYQNGHVRSSWEYPPSFEASLIGEQIKIIEKIFSLDGSKAMEFSEKLPTGFIPIDFLDQVDWYAFPKLSVLAKKHFPHIKKDASVLYCELIKFGLEKLSTNFNLVYDVSKITPTNIKQVDRTFKFLKEFENQQPGDIMLIPCQYGIMRRGESTLYSNNTLFDNEFGICLLGAIFMALTNPGRYVQFDELDSLCIGTEATPSVDDGYSHSIIIDLLFGKDKKLEIGFVEKKECYAYRGAITGFKPPLIM